MENLQQVTDQINTEILSSYAGLLSPKAQDFITRHQEFHKLTFESKDKDIICNFRATANVVSHMQSHFILLKTQQEIFSFEEVVAMKQFERWTSLCRQLNDEVVEFVKVARGKLL